MSTPPRFPKNPRVGENRWVDETGRNAFADSTAENGPASEPGSAADADNAYAASPSAGDYRPHGFEESASDRGAAIFALGAIGLSFAALGILIVELNGIDRIIYTLMAVPFFLVSTPLGWITWTMAQKDLYAIRSGVIQTNKKWLTVMGLVVGATTVITSFVFVVYLVVWQVF